MQDVFVSAPLFWCGEIYKWVQLESQTQLLNFPLALLYCASRWRFIRGFYRDDFDDTISNQNVPEWYSKLVGCCRHWVTAFSDFEDIEILAQAYGVDQPAR